MKKHFIPQTYLGKWAVGVGLILTISIILEIVFVFMIGGDVTVLENNFLLKILAGILSVLFTLSVPVSLILGIIVFIKYREWAVIRSLLILYFLTLILFLIGEFSFPH